MMNKSSIVKRANLLLLIILDKGESTVLYFQNQERGEENKNQALEIAEKRSKIDGSNLAVYLVFEKDGELNVQQSFVLEGLYSLQGKLNIVNFLDKDEKVKPDAGNHLVSIQEPSDPIFLEVSKNSKNGFCSDGWITKIHLELYTALYSTTLPEHLSSKLGFNVPAGFATAFTHAYCGRADSFFAFFSLLSEEDRNSSNDRVITLQADIPACGPQVFDLLQDKENNNLVDAYAMFRLIYQRFGADILPDKLVSQNQKAALSLSEKILNESRDLIVEFGKWQEDSETILLVSRYHDEESYIDFYHNGEYLRYREFTSDILKFCFCSLPKEFLITNWPTDRVVDVSTMCAIPNNHYTGRDFKTKVMNEKDIENPCLRTLYFKGKDKKVFDSSSSLEELLESESITELDSVETFHNTDPIDIWHLVNQHDRHIRVAGKQIYYDNFASNKRDVLYLIKVEEIDGKEEKTRTESKRIDYKVTLFGVSLNGKSIPPVGLKLIENKNGWTKSLILEDK